MLTLMMLHQAKEAPFIFLKEITLITLECFFYLMNATFRSKHIHLH